MAPKHRGVTGKGGYRLDRFSSNTRLSLDRPETEPSEGVGGEQGPVKARKSLELCPPAATRG